MGLPKKPTNDFDSFHYQCLPRPSNLAKDIKDILIMIDKTLDPDKFENHKIIYDKLQKVYNSLPQTENSLSEIIPAIMSVAGQLKRSNNLNLDDQILNQLTNISKTFDHVRDIIRGRI